MVTVIVTDFLALVFLYTQHKTKAKEINFPISVAREGHAFILSYTLKKQKNIESGSPNRPCEGDAWIYTCVKRITYFFVAFSVGKQTQETCGRMMKNVSGRTEQPSPQNRIEVFTDGNTTIRMFCQIIIPAPVSITGNL